MGDRAFLVFALVVAARQRLPSDEQATKLAEECHRVVRAFDAASKPKPADAKADAKKARR